MADHSVVRGLVVPILAAVVAAMGLTAVIAACSDGSGTVRESPAGSTPDAVRLAASGGAATVDNDGANAFAQPTPGLSAEQRRAFEVGNNFFNDNWVTAPASTTARDGLGPTFNAQSCSSCHFKDGRGQPPTPTDPGERGLLLRLSVPGNTRDGAPVPHPNYGDQLQDRSINGVSAEGAISISEREIRGTYLDGTPYSLMEPTYEVDELAYGPLGNETMASPRIAPPVFGVGLLEAIPESTIRDLAQAQAAEKDEISGRANMVWSPAAQATALGRFGWKANVATVEEQTLGAFLGDIGITSTLFDRQNCMPAQPSCSAAPAGGEPELTDNKAQRVTFYSRALAVPERRNVGEPQNKRGSKVFERLNCSACHVPEIATGDSDLAPLSNQTIRPYTDLLLHDMGPRLADGRPDFGADGSEWRTPPLWGIGLTETVNGHTRFLHDGRARNLEEAILWHGGEAAPAQRGFIALPVADRVALIAFLNSL